MLGCLEFCRFVQLTPMLGRTRLPCVRVLACRLRVPRLVSLTLLTCVSLRACVSLLPCVSVLASLPFLPFGPLMPCTLVSVLMPL